MALLPTVPFSSGLYEIRKEKNMKVDAINYLQFITKEK